MKYLFPFIFFFAFTFVAYAQEHPHANIPDSSAARKIIPLPFVPPSLALPLSLQKQNEFSAQYLRASFANSISQMSLTPQTGGDLSSIWQHEWAKQNENRTLKMILQSVEAGGTAYILYEHIKKYGLK